MRIAHIHDPLIGVITDVYLPVAQDSVWQKARIVALKKAFRSAAEHKAECILISGRLFAEVYVTSAVVSEVLDAISEANCEVVWMPDATGLRYLEHNDNLPDNLTLLTKQQRMYTIDGVSIMLWSAANSAAHGCNILITDNDQVLGESVLKFFAKSVGELKCIISNDYCYTRDGDSFVSASTIKIENSCFEDNAASGYHIFDFIGVKLADKEFIESYIYRFKTVHIAVESEDDQKSVFRKCVKAALGLTDHDFVRIILNGNVDVETSINADELRDALKGRFFYLEVFNECELQLDKNVYASDISLKSEFIRMVVADDMLSETEKSRIIQCGWNALMGKELSE